MASSHTMGQNLVEYHPINSPLDIVIESPLSCLKPIASLTNASIFVFFFFTNFFEIHFSQFVYY